jgi:cell division protein FtsL
VIRVNILLLALVIACALGVITSQHQARKRFIEIENEQAAAKKIAEEFTQLQLEQSTWATHQRVAAIATSQLGMRMPDPSTTAILTVEPRP